MWVELDLGQRGVGGRCWPPAGALLLAAAAQEAAARQEQAAGGLQERRSEAAAGAWPPTTQGVLLWPDRHATKAPLAVVSLTVWSPLRRQGITGRTLRRLQALAAHARWRPGLQGCGGAVQARRAGQARAPAAPGPGSALPRPLTVRTRRAGRPG
jgi:hypothetical protein